MRFGILSDTHGVLNSDVANVLSNCDCILHAGDIGNAGVLKTLGWPGADVHAVLGNNDVRHKWPDTDHAELERLPESICLNLPGGKLVMEHGHRIWDTRNYHGRLRRKHPDAKLIIYGHTHVQVVDIEETPWVANPGAAGRQRTKLGPSCMVLDVKGFGEHARWDLTPLRFTRN